MTKYAADLHHFQPLEVSGGETWSRWLHSWFVRRSAAMKIRRELSELSTLDGAVLADIGVSASHHSTPLKILDKYNPHVIAIRAVL